ncbi:unnamed protein product [Lactuca virosa]|uniref:Myosin motor domain-containing protein n=1 Tax=Lactuca virosa TaxID=75947 RepID=A0AAU9LUP9_9ASTR|nr:unnamed protein product [Lactuca virosa]
MYKNDEKSPLINISLTLLPLSDSKHKEGEYRFKMSRGSYLRLGIKLLSKHSSLAAIWGTFCFSNPLAIQHPPIDMSSNQNASASIGKLEDTRNRTLNGILHVQSCFRGHKARQYLKELKRGIFTLQSYVRGEKTRKEFGVLLQRHRAAVVIQKQIKSKVSKKRFEDIHGATVVLQAVIRGWLVRRSSGDIALLQFGSGKGNESDEVVVKSSYLAELQRRILKAEAGLREKEEENDILYQRLQQYESRW